MGRAKIWVRRLALGALGLVALLTVLAGAALLTLNSGHGRDWVKDQVEALEFENGLRIGIGQIDGSLLSVMILRDITLSDPQGVFASAPEVFVDWSPTKLVAGHIDINALRVDTSTLSRTPEFAETAPSDEPLLPDYTITLGDLTIKQIVVEEAVAGTRRSATITGSARIEDRSAQVTLNAQSLVSDNCAPGAPCDAAGDEARLELVAAPEEDRLDIDLDLKAPADGVIAALAGLDAPLSASLQGEGTWSDWQGRLTAQWNAQPLADLALTAQSGVFGVNGEARLAQVAPDAFAQWLDGPGEIAAEIELGDTATRLDARFKTRTVSLTAAGGVALSENRLDDMRVGLDIAGSMPLSAEIRSQAVKADLVLNGAFTRPDITYDLRAQRLAYAGYGLERFSASGETRFSADAIRLPLNARAGRVTGLDQATGGPLVDIQLSGDLLIDWPRLVSENLKLKSRRLDADVTLMANASAGRYGGAIEGQLDNYRLESVGLFDVASGATVDINTRTGVAVKGKVQARSTQVSNGGLRSLFGGDTAITSDVEYQRDGVTRLSNMRLASPLLQVSEGGGTYSADGEFDITAKGQSSDYGPLALELTGTLASPEALISAQNPGLGVGLANVEARVLGEEQVFRIEAQGVSDFGAISGVLRADVSKAMTELEVVSANVGGVGLTGRLIQTEAGPFVGELDAKGSGLDGRVELASQNGFQAARINARANGLTLPGQAGLRVGEGRIEANVLFAEQPEIRADIRLANTRYFATRIASARAEIELANGVGTAKVLATGRNNVPFRVALNADLQPDLWSAAIKGRVRGIAFSSETPARIIPASASSDNHYELLPTRLAFDDGEVRLSGRFGPLLEIKSRIDTLDLALLNRFNPGLGLTGMATGSLDFLQADANAMPVATADIEIKGAARSTALTVSDPVNLHFAGQMREGQASGRAVIRQGGDVIGRIHTNLEPLRAPGGDWVNALLTAPLSGGIRYTGSASTVFSLAGLVGQELDGALGIAADFSGQLVQPSLDGIIRAKNLTYENLAYGTELTDLNARGRFQGDQLVIEDLTAQAGNGRVEAKGTIGLASEQGFPMTLDITLDNARLAASRELGASATGDLKLTKVAGKRGLLSGTLNLPETRYALRNEAVLEVPELDGVRFASAQSDDEDEAVASALRANEPGFEDLRLDLRLKARNELFVTGLGLQSEWGADLRVTGTSAAPRLSGEVDLVRGTLDFAGRAFDIESGRIRFLGGATFDPEIAISATEQIREVAVTIEVDGRAFSPEFEFSSTPNLPQDEILARILFGSSIANLSALEAVQLAQSLNTLSGSGGGLNPLGSLRSATGIDRLRLLAADESTGQGTALAAGQYISDDIYVEVITDARGFTATQLEISLSRTLSVLSQASGVGGTNVNLRYRKDY